jgi:hypothetical protein
MAKMFLVPIILLSVCLLTGGFALAWKNKDTILAAARVGVTNQQWIEIKPRLTSGQNNDAAGQSTKTKKTKSASGAAKGSDASDQTDTASKDSVKKTVPQIAWCSSMGAKVKVPAVAINEVAWMGTDKSHTDEWIELKNLFRESVDISGWQLQNKNKSVKIVFKEDSVVPLDGYYLLERTDDTTVPEVAADAIYTGNLANANEALYLFDTDCQLQDSVIATPAWPAGDNASKRTMERTAGLLWKTSVNAGGTPKQENSVYQSR